MIFHDIVQNSPQWDKIRIGIATASCFDQLITAVKAEPSKQAAMYENEIVAEILTGQSQDDFGGTRWTIRGHELEPEAIECYRLMRDNAEVTHGGFFTNDAATYGASPDNLVNDDGLLEVKCLSAKHHIRMLLNPLPEQEHRPQLQGQLLVTGRAWVDNLFYHPQLPPLIIRVERDEEYIAKLQTALDQFTVNVQTKLSKIRGQ